jgi:DNA-binding response OmpR family regulator
VDPRSREVWVRGSALDPPLSRKEFDVLNLLFQKRGEACSKDEIAVVGWPEGDVGDQEIEQSIRRLRLRVETDPSQPQCIITIRGFGYKLP